MHQSNPRQSHYAALIKEATGCPDNALAILEEIMRQDIFHSTLDWQTHDELMAAARKALVIYGRDQTLFDADFAHRRAFYERGQAEQALASAIDTGDQALIKAARTTLDRAKRKEVETGEKLSELLGIPVSSAA